MSRCKYYFKIWIIEERHILNDLKIKKFVHAHAEIGRLLVEEATHCCDLRLHRYDWFY